MSRSAFKPASRFATLAAGASLAFALSSTVSHQAMAACTSSGAPGDTTVTCSPGEGETVTTGTGADSVTVSSGSTGAIYTDGANDTVTVTGGTQIKSINTGEGNDTITIGTPETAGSSSPSFLTSGGTSTNAQGAVTNRTYSVTGGLGDDTITIYRGNFVGTVMGNAGNDKLNIYGGIFGNVAGDGRASADGTATGTDAPGNSVASSVTGNDIIKVYGGTINGEVQGGNGDDSIYLYGGTINRVEGNNSDTAGGDKIYLDGAALGSWEFPSGGAGGQTLYLRSGKFGVGAGDDDDDDTSASPALAEHLIIDPGNTEQAHPQKLQIGSGLNFGNGNDSLTFIGAVNTGENQNFEFTDDDVEFNGGGGDDDSVLVTALVKLSGTTSSNVVLGELENFEELTVEKGSKLTLTDDEYTFAEKVKVDGTSELVLSGSEVEFNTEHFELKGGDGIEERLSGLPSYYHDFETGGILRIGAVPGAQAGGDDDDDEEVSALEEEDDEETSGPVTVTFNTGPDTFVNGGTIAMMNGIVGDTLVINDHYDSQDGNLAIDTELGNSASPTDNLTINGPVTGTTTTVYVNNVGGKGAFTGQGKSDGIEIATSGTDAFAPDSFTLATNALTGRKEVLAGAFAYRLAVTDDAALLQSDILDQVPAYVTAPSVAQRFVSSGLDTLYKRLGEIRNGYNGGATSANGHIWVRGNYSDYDVDPKEGFSFEQKNRSVLAGGGVTVAADGASRLDVGVFGGYGTADADVKAVIFGASSESSIDVKGWTGGGYVTYYELGRTGTGLYIDGVFKADSVDFDMAANSRAAGGSTSGDSFTTSGEIGYGFGIGGGMVIQPQAQLAYTDLTVDSFKDSAPYGLGVSYGVTESLIGRIGVQLQANLVQPGGGTISPYAIFNVLSEFEGNNKTTVAATDFRSDVSGTWYSAGGGVTAQFAENVSLYGSGEYSFGDVEGWQGTGGVKVNW